MALLLSLFSFADRARSWPPRAPLDFPEPSPYPQPSIAVGCLVWLATTPSAESRYLSALTLLGGLHRSTGSTRFRRKLDRSSPAVTRAAATRSSAGYLSLPDLVGATLWILTVVNTAGWSPGPSQHLQPDPAVAVVVAQMSIRPSRLRSTSQRVDR